MKTVFVNFAAYQGDKAAFFEKYTEPRFRKYCDFHGFEYYGIKDYEKHPLNRQHATWMSWLIIDNLIDSGYLQDGDNVFSIDADTCIYDITKPFMTSKSFGYAIDSCNTHCMGAYTIKINAWTRKLVKDMLDPERYDKLKDTPIWKMWNDQAAWYTLAGVRRHSWKPFPELPSCGWHSHITDDTLYSLDELEQHVEIMPTEWNVTHVAGESFNEYFIIPTHKKDTIIRHFAGVPHWDENYFLESENA